MVENSTVGALFFPSPLFVCMFADAWGFVFPKRYTTQRSVSIS